jgi:hypothetical protein
MARPGRKPSRKLTRHQLDKSAEAVALITQFVPVGKEAELVDLIGWRDVRGNLRRARATWDNAWSADLFFTMPKDGKISLSSYRINWSGSTAPKGAAA